MKKRFFISMIFFSMILGMSIPVSAEEMNEYDSNSRVGFYGSYPVPKVPDAQSPTPSSGVQLLPQTGETNSSYKTSLGFFLMIVSYTIYINNRKNKEEEFQNEIL